MQNEIRNILDVYNEIYDGDPWFGRNVKDLLSEIKTEEAIQKPNGQHSILQLLYHMINWREFTISRLSPEKGKTSSYFGKNDWVELDHSDKTLWKKGLKRLEETQKRLLELIAGFPEERLTEIVAERDYDFRYLLYGVIQHDIYHIGQIAYVKKMLI
ncbi:MAG TPA: DinB family protein [Saprospiraceae bacterium]|nr:DinB family protein [Saprospiraceae bacterium]